MDSKRILIVAATYLQVLASHEGAGDFGYSFESSAPAVQPIFTAVVSAKPPSNDNRLQFIGPSFNSPSQTSSFSNGVFPKVTAGDYGYTLEPEPQRPTTSSPVAGYISDAKLDQLFHPLLASQQQVLPSSGSNIFPKTSSLSTVLSSQLPVGDYGYTLEPEPQSSTTFSHASGYISDAKLNQLFQEQYPHLASQQQVFMQPNSASNIFSQQLPHVTDAQHVFAETHPQVTTITTGHNKFITHYIPQFGDKPSVTKPVTLPPTPPPQQPASAPTTPSSVAVQYGFGQPLFNPPSFQYQSSLVQQPLPNLQNYQNYPIPQNPLPSYQQQPVNYQQLNAGPQSVQPIASGLPFQVPFQFAINPGTAGSLPIQQQPQQWPLQLPYGLPSSQSFFQPALGLVQFPAASLTQNQPNESVFRENNHPGYLRAVKVP